MKHGDFEAFIENVKQKTILTPWMQQIKSNPKDQTLYLVLADFLGDQGGLFSKVGDFLRNQVKAQTDQVESNDLEFAREISNDFLKLGIGNTQNPFSQFISVPNRLTASQTTDSGGVNLRRPAINSADNIQAMSATVAQLSDRPNVYAPDEDSPRYKKWKNKNVAFHDIPDVNVQLFIIFLIAQRIGTNLLVLNGNQKDNCEDNVDMTDLMNHWVQQHWADEDEDNLIRVVNDYGRILPFLQKSWECCDKLNDESASSLAWQLSHLDVEGLDDDHMDNWVAQQIVSRWMDAIAAWRLQGCKGYRKHLSAIIKDFRNSRSAYRIYSARRDT